MKKREDITNAFHKSPNDQEVVRNVDPVGASLEISPEIEVDDLFVGEVLNRSFEPRIPKGSVCVFRRLSLGRKNDGTILLRKRNPEGDQFFLGTCTVSKQLSPFGEVTRTTTFHCLSGERQYELDANDNRTQIVAELVQILA